MASMGSLGVELVEMPVWNCCGTVYSLAVDELMHQLAPVRNLLRLKEQGENKVVSLCTMCYNSLKRVNMLMQTDREKRGKIVNFISEGEGEYGGEVEVLHLLEVLRDDIGFERVNSEIKNPLQGLKVAPYYGCLLLRPAEVAIDDPLRPTILESLLVSLGAQAIDFPHKTECCGSFQTVNNVELVVECARRILDSAVKAGAEVVITSCPLCAFNLDHRQREIRQIYSDFRGLPILYFTQLMALALGLGEGVCRFDLNHVDPRPLLASKGVM
jgi:heterodisulfide reductase subunit B